MYPFKWTPTDKKMGTFYSISIDIQLLLGLILYFLFSPITKTAISDFSTAMSNPDLRFFALEHAIYTVLALILAHVGVAAARRATEDVAKHRRAAIWFSLSLIALLLGMPWFRPLLPAFGG
jgi:cell division protein FtsW (lipid II flippase)